MKLAIVHDFLHQKGGAEKVLNAIAEVYPDAPIFTLIYNKEKVNMGRDIRFIGAVKYFPLKKHYKYYLPILPFVINSFKLDEFDVILSSSYAWVKAIGSKRACKISYCHTPMRFAHDMQDLYLSEYKFRRFFIKPILELLRLWDIKTAKKVDYFIANSYNISEKIKKVYGRDSTVIYPPCDTDYFTPGAERRGDYFLIVSRLVLYKRIDIAIRAFNELGLPLKIIGTGAKLDSLKRITKPNVEIMGFQTDEAVRDHYRNCRAVISCAEEDFGISMAEAQSSGAPLISFKKGGALEIIKEPDTGIFFDAQTPESLIEAVRRFEKMSFDKTKICKNAERFSKNIFKEKIKNFVDEKYKVFKSQNL